MLIRALGLVGFDEALALQEQLVAAIASDEKEESLLLLEHPPLYTIGNGGTPSITIDTAFPVIRTNRGGDVTYHGPGQLIGYPLLKLDRFDRDLHRYLRFLEEVLIQAASAFDVAARRIEGRTGIWTERGKLASIGCGVRRWISMHGFALNVSRDLAGFEAINPCGIPGCPMTSLELETGTNVDMRRVVEVVAERLNVLVPSCR